jgi:site-specific DNA-cytosine methylase
LFEFMERGWSYTLFYGEKFISDYFASLCENIVEEFTEDGYQIYVEYALIPDYFLRHKPKRLFKIGKVDKLKSAREIAYDFSKAVPKEYLPLVKEFRLAIKKNSG